jgi:hypothetical protein
VNPGGSTGAHVFKGVRHGWKDARNAPPRADDPLSDLSSQTQIAKCWQNIRLGESGTDLAGISMLTATVNCIGVKLLNGPSVTWAHFD